jgi:hypothetical protein
MTQLGQQSAAGVGASGMSAASSIANLLGQRGEAQAGGALARGKMFSDILGEVGGIGKGLF